MTPDQRSIDGYSGWSGTGRVTSTPADRPRPRVRCNMPMRLAGMQTGV
jgi:hypothetical protein